jgi:hypothetical protein
MRVKKTIWRPLVLGLALGSLAGVATVTGLSFLAPGINTDNAIGFYMTLLLLAAALGGPSAGVMASILLITISAFWGPPDMMEIMSDPVIFWTNLPVVAMLMVLVGLAYHVIFERLKMPVRLVLWAGIVIAVYIINSPANLVPQYYFHGEVGVLPAILSGYKVYIPQAIFDIFFTCLVFVALPTRYLKPLWYEPKKAAVQDR